MTSSLQRDLGGLRVPRQTLVRGHSVGVPTLWMDERLATVLELAKASQADL